MHEKIYKTGRIQGSVLKEIEPFKGPFTKCFMSKQDSSKEKKKIFVLIVKIRPSRKIFHLQINLFINHLKVKLDQHKNSWSHQKNLLSNFYIAKANNFVKKCKNKNMNLKTIPHYDYIFHKIKSSLHKNRTLLEKST